jgi:hypothetical protein
MRSMEVYYVKEMEKIAKKEEEVKWEKEELKQRV